MLDKLIDEYLELKFDQRFLYTLMAKCHSLIHAGGSKDSKEVSRIIYVIDEIMSNYYREKEDRESHTNGDVD